MDIHIFLYTDIYVSFLKNKSYDKKKTKKICALKILQKQRVLIELNFLEVKIRHQNYNWFILRDRYDSSGTKLTWATVLLNFKSFQKFLLTFTRAQYDLCYHHIGTGETYCRHSDGSLVRLARVNIYFSYFREKVEE